MENILWTSPLEDDEDKISTVVSSARKEPQLRHVDAAKPPKTKTRMNEAHRVKPMSPPGEIRCAAWRNTLVYENSIGFSDIIILQFLILLIHL